LVIVGNPKDSAADLAVAIANTWDTFEEPYERLATLADLRRFLDRVGRPEAARVARKRDLIEIRQLRARLRRVFVAQDTREAARLLNEIAVEAAAVPHLEHIDGTWKVRFGPSERSIAAHLGATAAAGLIDIVQAHELSRFGTCSGPPCTGVFVDATKNHSKRYCCHWCADREAQRRHRARST
jgi:predicted RNA-binding Zn ribbon-like protein